ncbi:MAG: glycosyltransferase family 39 protein [Nitrospirota bacterium]
MCALSVRLILTWRADPVELVFPDSRTYFDPALSLHESGSFLNRYQTPEITRTPGYPLFLTILMTVFGTEVRALLIAQTVIVSLSVVILYWLARQILPPVMAYAGAWLAAVSPWGAVRAGFLLTDGVFLLLLVSLFALMYGVIRSARTTVMVIVSGSLVGLLTSAVVLVRPIFPLILFVAVVLVLFFPGRRSRAWLLVTMMVMSASIPLHFWKMRNLQEAQFHGFSDVSGKAAWQWLASSVKAKVPGASGDRWAMLKAAEQDETHWTLSLQQADDERWRLANDVFTAHPFLTVYAFTLNAIEALIHPEPDILAPARLRFYGDTILLGGIWMAFIVCAAIGLGHVWNSGQADRAIDRNWLLAMLIICCALTLTAGVSFGAGSRYRVPLEPIVPLLAGVGLVRLATLLYANRREESGGSNPFQVQDIG